jgi:hypothetical protein
MIDILRSLRTALRRQAVTPAEFQERFRLASTADFAVQL